MADFLQHENIVVSEQGVFEFHSGKQIDGVLQPEIGEIRIAYKTAAGRPILQGVIGIILLGIGICFVSLSFLLPQIYRSVGFLSASRSRTPAVLYLGTFPVHPTVALTALPAMSFVPLIPLFYNDCRGLSPSR
jgi:hypothetical protein